MFGLDDNNPSVPSELILGPDALEDVLFHELFHAYVRFQNVPLSLNMEIEAWVAQFRYGEAKFGRQYVDGGSFHTAMYKSRRGTRVRNIANLMNAQGGPFLSTPSYKFEDAFNEAVEEFRTRPPYSNAQRYPLNTAQRGIDNFKYIAELSTGC